VNKEDYFIKQISKNTKNIIGDDGAFIDGLVYSQDAFFENVHFKTDWMSLKDIAKKSMLVNISDAIVMNAKPKYAILTVAIPKLYTKQQLQELADGFLEVAKEFSIQIIGGDTISNTKLDISITIVSQTKKPIYRKGIKKNQLLAYTNTLGSVKKDLTKLLQNKKVSRESKFIIPKLHDKFFYKISNKVSSAMDISDGLFFELTRLSKINKLDFKLFHKIDKKVGCSGEEYEILFSFDKKDKKYIENIAKKFRIKLNIFAIAKRGKFKSRCKNHHF
jgi:thiamine-monophosphate kinase